MPEIDHSPVVRHGKQAPRAPGVDRVGVVSTGYDAHLRLLHEVAPPVVAVSADPGKVDLGEGVGCGDTEGEGVYLRQGAHDGAFGHITHAMVRRERAGDHPEQVFCLVHSA